ncbi:MAG: NYN domain-containing protein [Candidatus Bathyarchaeia archaeon]|jgi:uncharacterized LabA/DUF88 family protein
MSVQQRLMIFIDGANIFSAAYDKGAPRIKLDAMVPVVTEKQRNVGTRAYVKENDKREGFYQQLERKSIHIVRVSAGKSVDGRLIADMLVALLQNDFDIAVLCGGDRDYVQVVEFLKRRGKIVWVAAFDHSCNSWLRALADKFIDLTSLLDQFKES